MAAEQIINGWRHLRTINVVDGSSCEGQQEKGDRRSQWGDGGMGASWGVDGWRGTAR